MATTTLTSREFHQNSARVKRAAQDGPVIITDRNPAHPMGKQDIAQESGAWAVER